MTVLRFLRFPELSSKSFLPNPNGVKTSPLPPIFLIAPVMPLIVPRKAVPALSDSQFVIVRVFYLILLYVSIQFRLSLNPRHCSVGLSVFVDISPYKKEPFLALLLRLIYLVVTPSLVFTKAWFGINLRSK